MYFRVETCTGEGIVQQFYMNSNCTTFKHVWLFYGPLPVRTCIVPEISCVAMSIDESLLKSKIAWITGFKK